MPELPEVETVARDLRPLITGATIVDATDALGADAARRSTPEAFATGVAGRRIEAVGRRGKQIVVDLLRRRVPDDPPEDDRPAVRRAARAAREDPYVRLVLELEDGREIRFRDIRKFGRIGLYGADDGRSVREDGPRAAVRRVHGRGVPAAICGPQGPPQAAPARPVVRRRRRQHLRRRGALGGPPPSAPDRPDAAAGRRAAPVGAAPPDPRRGRDPARLVDRRLHGARRRRRDAGAPRGLPANRRAMPALRPADPADRRRRAGDALLLVVPAPARRAIVPGRGAILATMSVPERRGRAMDGAAGRGGERRAGAGGADGASRRGGADAEARPRPAARRRAPRSGG